MTGDVYGGSQSSYYGANPVLKIFDQNNNQHSIELTSYKPQGSPYTKEFYLQNQGYNCLTRNNIKEVHLKAGYNGNDGWYVSSINTYSAGNDRNYNLLTTDPGFSMWVDYNEAYLYPYIATGHKLTWVVVSECITYVKVEAKTGGEYGGAFSNKYGDNHLIVLELEDSSTSQAELEGPMYLNTPHMTQLHFASRFKTTRCVKSTDISAVYLKTQPGGSDGWYIASVSTFVQSGVSKDEQITNDSYFNKWLDSAYVAVGKLIVSIWLYTTHINMHTQYLVEQCTLS